MPHLCGFAHPWPCPMQFLQRQKLINTQGVRYHNIINMDVNILLFLFHMHKFRWLNLLWGPLQAAARALEAGKRRQLLAQSMVRVSDLDPYKDFPK